jgi:hypothetical protein
MEKGARMVPPKGCVAYFFRFFMAFLTFFDVFSGFFEGFYGYFE